LDFNLSPLDTLHDVSRSEEYKNTDFEFNLKATLNNLREEIRKNYNRHVSLGDLLMDRWETASFYGFGEGTSCYNNVLIIGDVKVGKHSWIGPNVILDGSGGLTIGDYASISAGAQIYTHDTVAWSTSRGREPIAKSPTIIGDGVYIGPNSVIQKGLTLGNGAIIGAMSFINSNVPDGAKAFGSPAKIYPGL
jgi:acetyltransferase-like isoleucine patch superfamily enzyme